MSVREIRDALTTAYSANVRKSFFGGVVSSRLQAQDIGRVVTADLEKNQQKGKARNSNGGGNARRSDGAGPSQAQRQPQPQPVDPAAIKAARRQAQLEQQKKAAARNASMFDKASSPEAEEDGYAPVQPASVSKPGRGSLTQKLASVLTQPAKPEAKRQANGQQVRKLSASQHRAQPSQQQPVGKQGARPALNLQPTAAQKAAGSRNGQSLTALRSKAELKARASRAGGKQQQIDKSLQPPKAKDTKVCRNCQADVPLKEYFCEKRLPDGLMHMCMKCASKKGLSGKPATPDIIAAIMQSRSAAAAIQGGDRPSGGRGSASAGPSRASGVPGARPTASHAWGGPSHSRGAPGGQQRRPTPSVQGAGTLKGFYGGASRDGGSGARMAALGGRRQREDLDQYEDDFVEDDEEEEDWRAQLREVTGGWRKRREFSDDEGDDRMMEASAAEMRREEARSRKLGRQEDIEAEREEEARLAAKAAAKRARAAKKKKRKKRRTGVGAFVNDEASDDDEEEEDSEDESE